MDTLAQQALWITTLAGLCTGLGGLAAFVGHQEDRRLLALALAFSAGMMLSVSAWDLLPLAWESFHTATTAWPAASAVMLWFGLGVFAMWGLHQLVPEPDEMDSRSPLMRMGLLTALAIGLHNFPEGLATFAAGLSDSALGLTVAVAIALHNIPEGIAIAMPIRYATGSRAKAFWLALGSGLFEPLGALLGYLVLRPWLSTGLMGGLYAITAGVMVFLALHELVPAARKQAPGPMVVPGILSGIGLMGVVVMALH
ncbi:MAG: zinc transporter ZupT [Candidatus Sericytochromatia bacterium]